MPSEAANFRSGDLMVRGLFVFAAALLALVSNLPQGDTVAHGERVEPAAEECRLTPLPFSAVAAAFDAAGSPAVEPSAGEPAAVPFVMPAGRPVDDETLVGIVATAQELLACENAGNWLSAFALFSDSFLTHGVVALVGDRSQLDGMARPPVPLPAGQRAALLAVEDVRLLPDGRVGALVHADSPRDSRSEEVAYVTFTASGERWLVDSVV